MENAHTDSVVLDLPEYLTEDFESQSGTDFDCFHYSRTEVVCGGTAYDGRTQKNQCVVAPDGSTVQDAEKSVRCRTGRLHRCQRLL